jgi:hypothetical protein
MLNKIKIYVFLIGIIQINILYSQVNNDTIFIKKVVHTENEEIDTIIIKGGISPVQPQILIGTTFLPNTNKTIELLNKGLSPISLELLKECDNSINKKSFKDYPKFINIENNEDTLTIDVSVIAYCCHNFLGEAELKNDTLNLLYISYGGYCSCSCCFTLRYKFDTTMEKYYQTIKYVTINGSKKVGRIEK